MTTTPVPTSTLLCEVEVVEVEQLSPSFIRFVFDAPELVDCDVDGDWLDQRIKLVFPSASGLPTLPTDDGWYPMWRELDPDDRGHIRTYTVRERRGRAIVIDIVVHPGDVGPGCAWAREAKVGDRVLYIGPLRGVALGGREFDPGTATQLLLVGDETAVPAIAGILRDLPATATGSVFIEVPTSADELSLPAPEGMPITWLARAETVAAAHETETGAVTVPVVRRHVGLDTAQGTVSDWVAGDEIDPELWETPTFSSAGDALPTDNALPHQNYAWIAGEAAMVTTLRRALVKELGWDRSQVAFMGYWRHGRPGI